MTAARIAVAACLLLATAPPRATALPEIKTELKPATIRAFEAYMKGAEARIAARANTPSPLWEQTFKQGKAIARPVAAKGDTEVEDGLVHDWIGVVFIPGATLERTLRMVQDYDNHKNVYKPEVVDSRTLHREGDDFRVYMRLVKKQVLTVVMNTEHSVSYVRLDPKRCHARSYSTRIAEVEKPGAGERELPVGKDHGFLWRLNSFWTFEERDGGVYVEIEAISLSRDVPTGLGWLINPIVRNLPKDSLINTLTATRRALAS